jgi:hypothetical protein
LIGVAFLVPLAVYCLVLGLINRLRRPLMISAVWDFAGILFAASGFLALAGPAMLTGFSEDWRMFWLVGHAQGLAGAGNEDIWRGLAVTYFVVVVVGSAYVLWLRRGQTAVYNVNPDVFEEVLAGVLDATGLMWSHAGHRYFIRHDPKRLPAADDASEEGIRPAPLPTGEPLPAGEGRVAYPTSAEEVEQSAYLEVDAAPALRHVTLRWDAEDQGLRNLVEGELARALAEVRTRDNPVGTWMLGIGVTLLCTAFMIFGLVVLFRVLER